MGWPAKSKRSWVENAGATPRSLPWKSPDVLEYSQRGTKTLARILASNPPLGYFSQENGFLIHFLIVIATTGSGTKAREELSNGAICPVCLVCLEPVWRIILPWQLRANRQTSQHRLLEATAGFEYDTISYFPTHLTEFCTQNSCLASRKDSRKEKTKQNSSIKPLQSPLLKQIINTIRQLKSSE